MAEGITSMTWLAVFLGGGVGSVVWARPRGAMMGAEAATPLGRAWANVLATALLAWCAVAGALGANLAGVVLHDSRGVWRVQHLLHVCLGAGCLL